MEELWIKAKALIKERTKPNIYQLWIEPIRFVKETENTLALSVANNFTENRIRESYLSVIEECLKQISGKEINVELIVVVQKKEKATTATTSQQPCTPIFDFQSKNPRPLRTSFSFDTFVVGPQNIVAFEAAKAIASSENGSVPNGIILLLSPNGLGKTHLSQSAVALRNQKYPELRVHYLTVQDFTDMMTRAMRQPGNFAQKTKAMDSFKKAFTEADLLVLDEIDHLPGKKRTQIELAFIIDHLMDRRKKIIFCSNTSPYDIENVDNKIKSLLKMAPVIEIDAPDHKTRAKIFTQKAKLWNCPISKDVADYLAESVRGDVRKIEGVLSKLALHSQAYSRPVNMAFAKKTLMSILLKQEGITPELILNLVSDVYNIPVAEIKSRSRKHTIVWARYVVIYLLLKYCKLNHATISGLVNKSRSAIPRVPDEIKKHIGSDTQKKLQLEHVEAQLNRRIAA